MIASLWDLKQKEIANVIKAQNYHDSFPMGFETVCGCNEWNFTKLS